MFRHESRQMRGGCGTLALAIACLFAARSFAQAPQANADLATVFKDWQSRQGILKSARYVVTGTTEYKDKDLPPGNPLRPRRYVLLLDLVKKHYRFDETQDAIYMNGVEDPAKWEYRTRISTSAYDGKLLQKYRHRKANRIDEDLSDLSIGKGNLGPHAGLGNEVWPIFFAHGIVPTVHSPLLVDKWLLSHDPEEFDLAGRQMLRAQNCLLVRTDPVGGSGSLSDEFWIDPGRKSAILRYVYFTGTDPWSRFDISWKDTPHGWWVDRWSEAWSTGGRVQRITRFRVESFEANPIISKGDFTLPAEPGMKVTVGERPPIGKGLDPTKGALTTYRISPSGAWDEVSAKGFTTTDGKELPPERRRRWIAWTLGGGAATIGVLLFYLRRRRRKIVPS